MSKNVVKDLTWFPPGYKESAPPPPTPLLHHGLSAFEHVWFPFSGPWSPDARVWVRTSKSHLSSKPVRERDQLWEWKSTEEQPDSPCRGTQGQSPFTRIAAQFLRRNYLNVTGWRRTERLIIHTGKTIFLCCCFFHTERFRLKYSKDAISTKEVVSDENIEAQGDLLTSEWVINLKALP